MATITITLEGMADGKPVKIEKAASVPDEIVPYFYGFQRDSESRTFGRPLDKLVPVVDGDGKPVLDDQKQPTYRAMTDVEAFEAWTRGVRLGTLANVNRFVEEQVLSQARAKIPKIDAEATK